MNISESIASYSGGIKGNFMPFNSLDPKGELYNAGKKVVVRF